MKNLISMLIFFSSLIFPQILQTPLEKNNYNKVSSYKELVSFMEGLK